MITYDDLTRYAPPASDKDERDQWYSDHGYDIDGLAQMAYEVARYRLSEIPEGAVLTAEMIAAALATATLFGVELIIRVERDEPLDLSPIENGNGAA